MKNKVAIIIDGKKYTYGQLYSAVSYIASVVGEYEQFATDIKDTFTFISAVMYAFYAGKKAVILENCWPERYKLKLLEKYNDSICILSDKKNADDISDKFHGNRFVVLCEGDTSSYCKLNVQEGASILFPTYYFGERQFHEVSAETIFERCDFVKNVLKIDLDNIRTLCINFESLIFIIGTLLSEGTVSISDKYDIDKEDYECIISDIRMLDDIYKEVKNGRVRTKSVITYGKCLPKNSGIKSELKSLNIRNYNFYDFPYFQFITSLYDENGIVTHRGKAVKGVSAYILNDGGGIETNGISGNIAVTENNCNICSYKKVSSRNNTEMYLSGNTGRLRNDNFIYFDNSENGYFYIDDYIMSEKELTEYIIGSGVIKECELVCENNNAELYYVLKSEYQGNSAEWLKEYISCGLPVQYEKVYLTKCLVLNDKVYTSGIIVHDIQEAAHRNGFYILAETDTSERRSAEIYIEKDSESFHEFAESYLKKHISEINTLKIYECNVDNTKLDSIRCSVVPVVISLNERDTLDDTDRTVLDIFKSVLENDDICMNDSFFEHGGNSINFIKLCACINNIAGFEVPMTKVMKKPTPRNCADIIKSGSINEEKVEFVSRERLVCDTNVADNIYPCTENYKNDDKNDGCVLLTGCTGFIGSYILKSLLAMGIPKIYCLVRADSEESGAKRIYDVMEKYRIAYAYDDSRIEVVCGNLEESMLGMSADRYDELSDKVSVIYHNGAKVDFLYTYDMLKKANVEGTHEIMKFAVNKRNKLLNYISSAAVLSAVKESETNEKTDIKNNPPEISGYNQSKWVSDVMISKAMERGVNCNIFRLGTASGASDTGCCQVKDFAWLVIKMCINAGYCTDFNIDLNLTPVDIMADSISTIGNNSDNYSGNVYHIFNNKSISISEIFDWVSEYGYHIEKVPFDIWCLQINNYLNNSDDDELKAVYSIIYNSSEMSEELEDYETEKPVMKSDETIRMLFQSGIKMQSVSKEQFFNTIRYFVETGFLKEK